MSAARRRARSSVEQKVDRPLVADVAERAERGGRRSSDPDRRARAGSAGGTAGWCACSRRWSARTRRQRPHSVRGLPAARRGRAGPPGARREAPTRCAARAVVAEAPEDDDARQRDPRGNASREHDEGNAENERVHPLVVVVPESSDVPRSRDPAAGSERLQIATLLRELVMRMRGLEPPRPYGHTDLNRARLPIPPHPRGRPILASGRLTPR